MSMSPSLSQLIARARTDLRSGLPVVLTGDGTWLAAATEGLSPDTLTAFRALGAPVLALTSFRADTLKARAYDGDLARIALRPDMDATTIARLADPKDDLTRPMSGPFVTLRDGPAAPHRAALALLKSARLLPAAVVVETDTVPDDLTHLPLADLAQALSQAPDYREIVAGRVPMELAQAGRARDERAQGGTREECLGRHCYPPYAQDCASFDEPERQDVP